MVVDVSGYQYRFIEKSKMISSDEKVDIWERVKPVDTNKYYTPTLQWDLNPKDTPSFNTIDR